MRNKHHFQFSTFNFQFGAALAGLLAGLVNGIFGGAGGMVLIPALRLLTDIDEDDLFPTSVSAMLPWVDALPYLLGSVAGGVLVGFFGKRIPTLWLHRIFGALILWGGVRYLW